jgi:hypothetical protein
VAAQQEIEGRKEGVMDRPRRARYFPLALTATAAAIAACATSAARADPGVAAAPEAAEFARDVVGTTTAYDNAHADATRIESVDCVQASPSHYMCSYAVTRPNRPLQCHLMQATWTPKSAPTYTVTLAGRVRACSTLRDALRSLR